MRIEDIEYTVDGRRLIGQVAVDEYRRGPRPCVLVCHEGPGLDQHVRGRAVRLASLGYLAFALDYQGDGRPKERDEAMRALGELIADRPLTKRIARAGLDVLLAQDNADPSRVAAIGYCFGGVMALELARDGADLSAIVGFHSGAPTPAPQESRNISGRVLYCWGSADPFVSREARLAFEDDLTEAGVADWRIELYGGVGHCFTNPMVDGMAMPGVKYDAAADARSWRSALRLLDETLSPGEG
jgi:dienelactone hydrolase